MPFHLTCKACHFETTIETREECLEIMVGHKTDLTHDHVIEFEVINETPFMRGGVSDIDVERDWQQRV